MPEDTSRTRDDSGDHTSQLSNTANDSGNESTNTNRTFASQNSNTATNNDNPNRRHRRDLGIFDRFMDTFLRGARLRNENRNNRSPSPIVNEITEEVRNGTIDASQSEQENGRTSSLHSSSPPNVEDDHERAIIITVNYVFSDENRPTAPNRSGSLIMSLPNNASNREPGVIQEFIRLATQMAYSSIVNGLYQEKGTTLEKFKTFTEVARKDLGDNETCSICFEKFELLEQETKEQGLVSDDEIVHHKKRRLFDESSVTTSSSSNSRDHGTLGGGRGETATTTDQTSPVFLIDHVGDFEHVPIKMPCSHVFGQDCLCEWLKSHTTCPLCRFSVAEDNNVLSNNEGRNVSIFTIPSESTASSFRNISVRNSTVQTPILSDNNGGERATEAMHYFGFSPAATPELSTPVSSSNVDSDVSQQPTRRNFRLTRSRQEREARLPHDSRNSNPFSEVVDYIRGRTSGLRQPESLFPIGMTSRRTANGIETRLTDQLDGSNDRNDVDENDDLNMRSLFDASPMPEARDRNEDERGGQNSDNQS